MRKYILHIFLSFAPGYLLAQPAVTLSTKKLDLGTIMWNRPKTAEFSVSNTGNSTLKISKIETSCGCTGATCDTKTVDAGKSATVSVTYNAEMLGHFQKEVAVFTNASAKPVYVAITGNVVTDAPDYLGEYQYKIGDIKLNIDELEFDDVNLGDMPTRTIELFNEGATAYKPELMHLPKYLSAEAVPQQIMPNRGGKIIVTLNSNVLREMGLTQTSVYLSRYPGDKVEESNEIDVSAVMLPAARQLSAAQLDAAPRLSLSSDTLVLDDTEGKDQLKGTIILTNEGKSTLQITSLQVFNSALNVGVARKIAPGKQTKVKLTVLKKFLKEHSRNRLKVLMITNDPLRPKVTLVVRLKK